MRDLPLLLCFLFSAGTTAAVLYLGRYAFDWTLAPYRDTGFDVSPDWHATQWPNYAVAGAHGAMVLILALVHSARRVVFRRLFLLWGVSQWIQLGQMCVTRLPDPNPILGNRTWVYTMYPVQYMLGCAFIQLYCAKLYIVIPSWALGIFGMAILIPTRQMYTVGVLSGAFAGLLAGLVYHWYVRTSSSIAKRAILRFLEQDAINYSPGLQGPAGEPLLDTSHYASATNASSFVVTSPLNGQIPGMPDGTGDGHQKPAGFLHISHDDPRADFNLEGFRHPTLAISEYERCENELVDWVRETFTEKQRMWLPPIICLATLGFTGVALLGNLVAVDKANELRPIGIPLPDDLLYKFLPTVPDHTADVMLYIQVGLVLVYVFLSPMRFVIIRRVALPYGIIMGLRSITVPATFPPDPSPVCAHRQHPPGTTCGDLIFSGHTVAFLMSALVVRRYTRPTWVEAGCWAFTTCGLLAVVSSRLHYTRDVFTAVLVAITIDHLINVAIYQRPDRKLSVKAFRYFEMDRYVYQLNVDNETESSTARGHRHPLVAEEETECQSKNSSAYGTMQPTPGNQRSSIQE